MSQTQRLKEPGISQKSAARGLTARDLAYRLAPRQQLANKYPRGEAVALLVFQSLFSKRLRESALLIRRNSLSWRR